MQGPRDRIHLSKRRPLPLQGNQMKNRKPHAVEGCTRLVGGLRLLEAIAGPRERVATRTTVLLDQLPMSA